MKAVAFTVEENQPKRHSIVLKRKKLLNELLVNSRGVTYLNAVELYWYLRSFHNPIKARKKNGNVVSISKLHTDGLHLNREKLAKDLSCSKRTITENLALLERYGLIARDYTKKGTSVNHLVIYVLKDTPYFYNEYGVSENRISELKPHTSSTYNEANFGTKFNPLNIGVSSDTAALGYCDGRTTDNLEEELLLSYNNNNYSSLYDSTQSKKNNIRLVETNSPNPPLKKSSFGNDFYASSECEERNTYCDDTAGDDMPDYATAEFGLPSMLTEKANKKLPDPQPAPIAALEDRTNKMVSMQDLMQLIPEPIIETQEEEEIMALPAQKQDLRQHLNYEIHRTFPKNTSESLQESLVITPIAPNKIGVKFNKKIPLKTDEKAQLRECIKVVYGDSIVMVAINATPEIEEVAKPKIKMPTAEDSANRGIQTPLVTSPAEFKWQSIKDYLLSSIDHNSREHLKYALGQTNILSLDGRKLKLSAKYSACDKLSNHQSLVESAAKYHDVDIEVTNINDRDTLYFPWVFDSETLAPLILEKKDNDRR